MVFYEGKCSFLIIFDLFQKKNRINNIFKSFRVFKISENSNAKFNDAEVKNGLKHI